MGEATEWTAVLMVLLVTVSISGPLSADSEDATPRPFDPLGENEEELAVETALAHPPLRERLSEDHHVVGTALHTEKPTSPGEELPRAALVGIYDYGSQTAFEIVVDLDAEEILELEASDAQPPLTGTEIREAGERALDNETVRTHLREAGHDPSSLDWTARLWTGPGETTCPEERCALVAFYEDRDYHHEGYPLVALGAGGGVEDWITQPLAGEDGGLDGDVTS